MDAYLYDRICSVALGNQELKSIISSKSQTDIGSILVWLNICIITDTL